MDILFTHRYKYTTQYSVDEVRADIESITDRSWFDSSVNLTGSIKRDGSFTLTHKWSLSVIHWVETKPAYLSGILSVNENKTIIETSIRPNSIFVIFFYLMMTLFILQLFGYSMFENVPNPFSLILYPACGLILFGMMRLYTEGLRNKFEKMLQATPYEQLSKS